MGTPVDIQSASPNASYSATSQPNPLSFFSFVNIQGYIPQTTESKVNFVKDVLDDGNKLFIGMSETWLHNHLDSELQIENYSIYSANSTRKKSKFGRFGGGVAIYLR